MIVSTIQISKTFFQKTNRQPGRKACSVWTARPGTSRASPLPAPTRLLFKKCFQSLLNTFSCSEHRKHCVFQQKKTKQTGGGGRRWRWRLGWRWGGWRRRRLRWWRRRRRRGTIFFLLEMKRNPCLPQNNVFKNVFAMVVRRMRRRDRNLIRSTLSARSSSRTLPPPK